MPEIQQFESMKPDSREGKSGSKGCSHNSASHLLSEPLLGLISGDSLVLAKLALGVLSSGDSLSSSSEDDVEVHSENTCVGIVLDSQIDMLINTESEVTYIN